MTSLQCSIVSGLTAILSCICTAKAFQSSNSQFLYFWVGAAGVLAILAVIYAIASIVKGML